jgi:hypothetical protein
MYTFAENPNDYKALQHAVTLMNSPSLTSKLADMIGTPVEAVLGKLSKSNREKVGQVVTNALHKAADAALWTMEDKPGSSASTVMHKIGAAASGALGGFFGFSTVLIEVPFAITIMMRAVADVARSEGFSLADFQTRAECVQIFGMESGSTATPGHQYYAMKEMLKQIIGLTATEITANISAKSFNGVTAQETASLLAKLIEAVAARFGVVITEKVAAQIVPVVGAVAGATINALFTDHYQDMAKAFFTIKRLEKKYGEEQVKVAISAMTPKIL